MSEEELPHPTSCVLITIDEEMVHKIFLPHNTPIRQVPPFALQMIDKKNYIPVLDKKGNFRRDAHNPNAPEEKSGVVQDL